MALGLLVFASGYVMAVLLVHVCLVPLLANMNSQHTLLVALFPGSVQSFVSCACSVEEPGSLSSVSQPHKHKLLAATFNSWKVDILYQITLFVATTTRNWN